MTFAEPGEEPRRAEAPAVATLPPQRSGSAPAWTAIDFARTIHQTFYDQVKAADQKAGYVFTFLTILFVFTKDPRNILLSVTESHPMSARWIISGLFIMAASFSLICAALVILPRAKRGSSTLYWGAWAYDGGKDHNITAAIKDDVIISEYLNDARNLARLCRVKYTFVNFAFRGAAVTIACHLTLLMLG